MAAAVESPPHSSWQASGKTIAQRAIRPPQELSKILDIMRSAKNIGREAVTDEHGFVAIGHRTSIRSKLLDRLRAVFCSGSVRNAVKLAAEHEIRKEFWKDSHGLRQDCTIDFALRSIGHYFDEIRQKGKTPDPDDFQQRFETICTNTRTYNKTFLLTLQAFSYFRTGPSEDALEKLRGIESGKEGWEQCLDEYKKMYTAIKFLAYSEMEFVMDKGAAASVKERVRANHCLATFETLHKYFTASLNGAKQQGIIPPDYQIPPPPPRNPFATI